MVIVGCRAITADGEDPVIVPVLLMPAIPPAPPASNTLIVLTPADTAFNQVLSVHTLIRFAVAPVIAIFLALLCYVSTG